MATTSDTLPADLDALDARLAALQARLALAERTLGLPAPRHGPAPPDLPALLRRVAALERRAGVIPGLDPLPGFAAAPPLATAPAAPVDRPARWRWRAGAAVAALLGALAILPHPGGGGRPATAGAPTATPAPLVRPALAPRVTPVTLAPAPPAPGFWGYAEDRPAPAPAATPRGWAGPCRAGAGECVPDGDDPDPGAPRRTGPADEYTTP